jgi:glycosyltransferase involved in cell wall biosynthesis
MGSHFPPYGIFALFYCGHLGNHRRTVFVLDGDEVADFEFLIGRERSRKKRMVLTIKKFITKSILDVCVSKSPLTLVVGDALYKRYHNQGCVKKFHASWVKESDIISEVDILNKIRQVEDNNCLKIIFAGRLIEKKGPQVAIETARLLHQMDIPFELDIYGQGPMLAELSSSVNQWGLFEKVKMKGVLGYNDFCKALRNYDIILIPSLGGEQPRIVFDAMANGVCVVASNLPAFVDIVEDKRNGLLCDPQIPISFAQALEGLHQDRNMLGELILNGILTAKLTTIESMHEARKSILEAELAT